MRAAAVALLAIIVFFVSSPAARGDAVVDAKRRAAQQLFQERKFEHATALIQEVLAADASRAEDHALLARAQEQSGNFAEAAAAWRKVTELLPADPRRPQDRTLQTEARRRIAALDPFSERIDEAVEEFLKRIQAIGREAERANNAAAMERIYRLLGGTYHVEGKGTYVVVNATDGWQGTGLQLISGRSYQIRAVGMWVWTADDGRRYEITADGVTSLPSRSQGRPGVLLASVDRTLPFVDIGSDGKFTPQSNGQLFLGMYRPGTTQEVSGSIGVFVLAE